MTHALIDLCDGVVLLALLIAVVLWTDRVRETHRRARAIADRRRLAMDETRASAELYPKFLKPSGERPTGNARRRVDPREGVPAPKADRDSSASGHGHPIKSAAAPLATARRPTHRGDFDEYAK